MNIYMKEIWTNVRVRLIYVSEESIYPKWNLLLCASLLYMLFTIFSYADDRQSEWMHHLTVVKKALLMGL